MKLVSKFNNIKVGDWFLFKPILSEIDKKDKRKTIIIIKNGMSDIFFFSTNGELGKIDWETDIIRNLETFYFPSWLLYKLNKQEKMKYNKEIILGSLK